MSFAERLVLWLHIAFVIFTIGPVTLAISSAPRCIRRRDLPILRYLTRITMIFTIGSLGVLAAGIGLAEIDKDFSHPWLSASITLYVVAVALLVLIIRDQRKAIKALDELGSAAASELITAGDPANPAGSVGQAAAAEAGSAAEAAGPDQITVGVTGAAQVANVERGRIAMMGGVVNLIWLVILILMIWRP
jgi:hypothetical protein